MATLASLTLASLSEARAATVDGVNVQVNPIVGYEFVDKFTPYAHTHGRLIYGALATAGIPLFSLEGEYTHGSDSETFGAPYNLSTTDTSDRYRVGVRSSVNLSNMLNVHLRGGGEEIQNQHQEYVGSVQTVNRQDQTVYHPYLGLGAALNLTHRFQATVEVLATIPNLNDLTQNEYETTAGFAVRFP